MSLRLPELPRRRTSAPETTAPMTHHQHGTAKLRGCGVTTVLTLMCVLPASPRSVCCRRSTKSSACKNTLLPRRPTTNRQPRPHKKMTDTWLNYPHKHHPRSPFSSLQNLQIIAFSFGYVLDFWLRIKTQLCPIFFGTERYQNNEIVERRIN